MLKTLVASSRDTAKEAATESLRRQAGDDESLSSNKTLSGISISTAVKSCEELVRLVHRSARHIPMIVSAKTAWTKSKVSVGVHPMPNNSAQYALHACTAPKPCLQPPPCCGIVVLNSSAVQEITPRNNLPGVAERYTRLGELFADMPQNASSQSARGKRVVSSIESFIAHETMRPLLSVHAGITRSFLSVRMTVPVTASMNDAAQSLCAEAVALHAKSTTQAQAESVVGRSCSLANASSNHDLILPPIAVVSTSQDDSKRIEPTCAPTSRLGIGLRLNELLRRWMMGRSRKNELAVVICGLMDKDDVPKDLGAIMDSEPVPMAILTDVSFYAQDGVTKLDEGEIARKRYCTSTEVSASLSVCVDGAVRVAELVGQIDDLFERRALLLTASSQASYLGDAGAALSAQWANCSTASSKKISCADVNTLPLLSCWDCVVGGLTNVHRNYTNTPYSGAYGPHVCTGITSPGLLANYYRADKRKHGTISLSQDVADRLCDVITESHFVPVGKTHYVSTPIQTRGIPHGFVPGVHSVLRHYDDALETCRLVTGREDEPTVDGVFVLPFSGFTQALAPDVESTVDPTIRHAFRDQSQCSVATGRSYLSDTTSEEDAIFVEPLWRRPCQVTANDNPFATSYSYADTVFNVCCHLSMMILDVGRRRGLPHDDVDAHLDYFHSFVTDTVHCSQATDAQPAPPTSRLWATDFLVLVFGCVFPCSHAVNRKVVPKELSVLSSKMATVCKAQQKRGKRPVGVSIDKLLCADQLERVRAMWSAFTPDGRPSDDICAWRSGLRPLLRLLMKHQGSHVVPRSLVHAMRKAVDGVARAAWLVYSADGKTPPPEGNPLHGCPSPSRVSRTHLDPVFMAQGPNLEVDPRGCIVGILPFQLRQVLVLLQGAHLKNVKPQVVRNEGGLNLRVSSAADLLEQNGQPRSDKSISPLQIDADELAFGTRDAKVYGASLQRDSWDANILLLAPLLNRIEEPLCSDRRGRGEYGEAAWLKAYLNRQEEENKTIHDVQTEAKNRLVQAGLMSRRNFAWTSC